jgi:hypothetical protein
MAYAFAKRIKDGRHRSATVVVDTPPNTQIEVIMPCTTLAEFDRAMERFEQDLREAKRKAREWIAFGFSA